MADFMSTRWCFTVNNPGDWVPQFGDGMSYLVWQHEVGAEGTEHIQGYVRWACKKRFSTMKKLWPTAHFEKSKGSEEDNKKYCTKQETRKPGTEPVELGTYEPEQGKQGRRSDLEAIATKIKAGVPIRTIAADHPSDFVRYHQGLKALAVEVRPRPPTERDINVLVFWGPTGVGKTHRIRVGADKQGIRLYAAEAGRDTWGQYSGEEMVLFDEFRDTQWCIQEMNKYLDKWSLQLNCRYINQFAAWTHVVICSNYCPLDWYPLEDRHVRAALLRRITRSVHILSKDQDVSTENSEFDDDLQSTIQEWSK